MEPPDIAGRRVPRSPVAVVVDSASSVPSPQALAAGLQVVPLRLNIGRESFADGDVSLEHLLAHLDDDVKTSAPSPGEWSRALDVALERAEHVLVLTVSADMSSTYSSARLAAAAYGGRVTIIDTGTAAGAEGLVALAAAELAATGADRASVVDAAMHVIERVRLVATVSSLDQLVRSGRVPSVAGRAGKRLGVNPLFQFRRSDVRPLRPALSRTAALERIVGLVIGSAPEAPAVLRGAVLHASCPEAAELLVRRLDDELDGPRLFVAPFSPVMLVHTGPGLAGAAWWWDDGTIADPSGFVG